jgi:hypothetical protein
MKGRPPLSINREKLNAYWLFSIYRFRVYSVQRYQSTHDINCGGVMSRSKKVFGRQIILLANMVQSNRNIYNQIMNGKRRATFVDFISTYRGTLMESFLPTGWDLEKIEACCSHSPERVFDRQPQWHPGFSPAACRNLNDFDTQLGHEIAWQIKLARDRGEQLAMILPVGPWVCTQADYGIGGADGTFGRGMKWQGMSLWTTLHYGTTPWIPSTYMPTMAGKLFFVQDLAGPLEAELN